MTTPSSCTQPATASNPPAESMDTSGLARAIERNVQETFHRYNRSAVQVMVRSTKGDYLGTGSGFIVGQKETSYLVMTCQHCIVSDQHSEVALSIRLAGKTTEYKAEKLYDDKADVAIIKAKDIPEAEKCPVLQFENLEDPLVLAANTPIIQLGYVFKSGAHLNLYPAVTPGTIMTPRRLNGSTGFLDIAYTASGVHGASGSAVILNFKVIAMLYACTGSGQTLFARSVQAIAKIMRKWLQIPDGHTPSMEQMIQDMLMKI